MRTERDRVISVSLSGPEWRAFVARHPEPVHWIRQRILAELAMPAPDTPDAADPVATAERERQPRKA